MDSSSVRDHVAQEVDHVVAVYWLHGDTSFTMKEASRVIDNVVPLTSGAGAGQARGRCGTGSGSMGGRTVVPWSAIRGQGIGARRRLATFGP
jgi:hypothetical protein